MQVSILADAARSLGEHRSTVYRMVGRGEMRKARVGHRPRAGA